MGKEFSSLGDLTAAFGSSASKYPFGEELDAALGIALAEIGQPEKIVHPNHPTMRQG